MPLNICGYAQSRTLAKTFWYGAVHDDGCTSEMLRQVAGEPKCALALHSLSAPQTPEEGSYYLSPGRFNRYLKWMKATGYKPASISEWVHNSSDKKRVLLTFDDGYDDLYSELLPATIQFGLKPIVFLVSDRTGATNLWDHTRGLRRRNLLTIAQIREMQRYGIEFGSHTVTHPWLPSLSNDALWKEVGDSKRALEDMLGTAITTFAYPFGGVDQRVRAAVADASYDFAFTIHPGLNWWNDPLCLNRAEVSERDTSLDFFMKLNTGYGLRPWIGNRARSLETNLPTQFLRTAIRKLRETVRRIEDAVRP